MLGHLFTRTRKEVTQTDIVMTMTPRVLRRPAITEQDLRSFSVGGEAAPLLFEVPGVPPGRARAPRAGRPAAHRAHPPARSHAHAGAGAGQPVRPWKR